MPTKRRAKQTKTAEQMLAEKEAGLAPNKVVHNDPPLRVVEPPDPKTLASTVVMLTGLILLVSIIITAVIILIF